MDDIDQKSEGRSKIEYLLNRLRSRNYIVFVGHYVTLLFVGCELNCLTYEYKRIAIWNIEEEKDSIFVTVVVCGYSTHVAVLNLK